MVAPGRICQFAGRRTLVRTLTKTGQWALVIGALAILTLLALNDDISQLADLFTAVDRCRSGNGFGDPSEATTFSIFVFMGALVGLAAIMNIVQSPRLIRNPVCVLELKVIGQSVRGARGDFLGDAGNLWGVFDGLLLLACISPAPKRT